MVVGKHQALVTELEQQIASGEYGVSGGLPAISEVAASHNLSINTAKNAFVALETKGLIEKRGIQYYVVARPALRMTGYLPQAHELAEQQGRGKGFAHVVGTVVWKKLPAMLADKARVERSLTALHRARVSGFVNAKNGKEVPEQYTSCYYLPLTHVTDEDRLRMEREPSFDVMWAGAMLGAHLLSDDRLLARTATKEESTLLGIPENAPVLVCFEMISDEQGVPLTVKEVVKPAGQELQFFFPFTNAPGA